MKKIELDVNTLIKRVNELKREGKVDLSSDEDLNIALMNLIALEEHLCFTGLKTNKGVYFKLLKSVREIRKKLLRKIVKEPEGEVWCISKHLLAASMRLIEAGNKYLSKGERKDAYSMFRDAFYLYTLFWSINLKLIKHEEVIKNVKEGGWKDRLVSIIKRIIDCCKE